MFITPIASIMSLNDISKQNTSVASSDNTFKNILNDLISNVNQTEEATGNDIMKIASGNADDLHTITINSEKAELAILTAVQVRNKVLEAYNEIMRVTL